MSLLTHTSMSGLSAEQQAAKAMQHVLNRVAVDDRLYYLMGQGTQSFDLLTEAYATLTGREVEEIRATINTRRAI